jgi:LppP/LprE lipoprotein/DnaJ domain
MQDLYKVLKVSPRADSAAIADAYERLLASANGDGEARRQLKQAYAVLGDEERRREYDVDRTDPRKLRALLAVDGRKEQIVWNMQGRSGRKALPPPKPVDPWSRSEPQTKKARKKQVTKKAKVSQPVAPPTQQAVSGDQPEEAWEAVTERTLAAAELVEPSNSDWPDVGPVTAIASEIDLQPVIDQATDVKIDLGANLDGLQAESTQDTEVEENTSAVATLEAIPHQIPPGKRARPSRPTATKQVTIASREKTAKPAGGRRRKAIEVQPDDAPTAEPMDPEATMLTSWRPEMAAPRRSPYWNPLNILAQLSFVIVTIGATVGVYLMWQMLDEGEKPVEGVQSLSPDVLETLAAPPPVASASQLPESLVRFANTTVGGFRGPDGRSYQVLGVAATQTLDGSFFYAAVGRDESSLDGTGQRVFFFLDDRFLGTDWDIDTRSISGLVSLVDGQIRVSYREFALYDSTCCPSLPDYVVTFSYDGSLLSDQSQPPAQVFGN